MTTMVEMMQSLHRNLDEAHIPHGFGGALALAWCVEQARATRDIDLNLFVNASEAERLFDALPSAIGVTDKNRAEIARDGQTRLRWDEIPVDVFFSTTPFHEEAARRVRWDGFAGAELPFLDCTDLAVFKAFFNRDKDWVDLSVMLHDGTLDVGRLAAVLSEYLGGDDERVERVRNLEPKPWS